MGYLFNTQVIKDLDSYLTVKSAADFSGYNQHYLRRLLREDVFRSRRIGQLWLIERDDFLKYLANAKQSDDKRYGPQ